MIATFSNKKFGCYLKSKRNDNHIHRETWYYYKLVSISGTITRTTEVRPELIMGSFRCLSCNFLNKNIV